MPGLQARSPVEGAREATTHWCFSPFVSPSFPFSLEINKIFKKKKKKKVNIVYNIDPESSIWELMIKWLNVIIRVLLSFHSALHHVLVCPQVCSVWWPNGCRSARHHAHITCKYTLVCILVYGAEDCWWHWNERPRGSCQRQIKGWAQQSLTGELVQLCGLCHQWWRGHGLSKRCAAVVLSSPTL